MTKTIDKKVKGEGSSKKSFTMKGYNDKPKPCIYDGCEGTVYPTRNANIGKCDTCKKYVGWNQYVKTSRK